MKTADMTNLYTLLKVSDPKHTLFKALMVNM